MTQPDYRQLAQAFDLAAQNYDAVYQRNPIMTWMRTESLTTLQAVFPPGGRLLELGCGTGDEAVTLSQAGYRIVATDISPAMIEAARRKARAAEAVNVTWHVLPAGQMSELTHDDGPATFDGAYASFGALNCEPRLDQVAAVLAHLLRPGAALVCSVMNRWCAWEIAWGLLHLRPGQACRRLKLGWVPAGLASPEGHLSVPTRYYSPQAFARRFAPHFRIQRLRGLPVLLPPPYLDTSFERHRALFDRVEAIERCLRDRFPFYALGDHFLIVMVRAATEKGP